MPLVRIAAPDRLPMEKVRALADAVHGALMATCGVRPDNHFQVISRFPAEAMIIDPTYGGVERSAEAAVIEIFLLSGRSDEAKRSLYREIAQRAVVAGFRADDMLIALVENHPIDWSLGRGLAYASAPTASAR
jgi:Tautomerase enzyme